MGTTTTPYDLYVPIEGEDGDVWGDPVAENFQTINDELLADSTALTTETTARTTADATNAAAIAAETTARTTADTTLQTNITAEAAARTTADTTVLTSAQAYADAVAAGFVSLATSNTFTNTNNFTGALTKSGVGVATTNDIHPTGKNPITGYYHLKDNGGIMGASPASTSALADSTAALQALVDTVPYGSTIWLDGYFRLDTTIHWVSGVSMKAAHHAAGGICGYMADTAVIRHNVTVDGAAVGSPLVDCIFENFEMDCDAQTLTGGTYTVACKGFVIQYLKRCHFRGLYVHGSHASGIGVDFLTDGSSITGNIVVNCGRSHPTASPSASGGGACIGIGLRNATNEEPLTIANNYCAGNGSATPNTSYGIFAESQTAGQSTATSGLRITGNYIAGCQVGIGDSGGRHSVVANNQITACSAGIGVDNGTFGSTHVSYDGIAIGNNIYGCTGPGFIFDYQTAGGKYTVTGNTVSTCNQAILFKFAGSVNAAAVTVTGNNFHDNKYSAIRAYYPTTGTGGFTESEFSRNFVYNNGTQATTGDKDGIRMEVPLTNVQIRDNVCFDRQGSKTQGYGIVLTAAAVMTGGSIRGNDLRNNLTGAASIATAVSATTWVASNAGYTPVPPAAVSVTASPMTYTGPDFPSYLFVTGGTVTDITIGGVTVRATTEGVMPLESGDSVVITYSSAPTLAYRSR